MKNSVRLFFIISLLFLSCTQSPGKQTSVDSLQMPAEEKIIINVQGQTIKTRFNTPEEFERTKVDTNSFAHYLRHLPLKPSGTKVKYFNGDTKHLDVYDAVVDMEISNRNLQQCADAIMRLKGEYLYSIKAYDKISFNLTNDFKMDYSEWMEGNRLAVEGNKTSWRKTTEPSNTYKDFRNYMEMVFAYAGTISLAKELQFKNLKDLAAGDVFIIGGSPGHAVIVVDVAENKSGEKVFMIAQSYMPAQETQILKNKNDDKISPWYSANIESKLYTPEWTFDLEHLKAW